MNYSIFILFIGSILTLGSSQPTYPYADEVISSPQVTNWGSWGAWDYCPVGCWATGFQIVWEKNRFTGDDTGLNEIILYCTNKTAWGQPCQPNTITSDRAPWGTEVSEIVYCPKPYGINGFQLLSEGNQGSGDDTAANNILFFCDDGSEGGYKIATTGSPWGDWTAVQRCSPGLFFCGIQTQIEENQGSGDDTAINNAKFACCRK